MLARRLVVSMLAIGFLVWLPTAATAQTKMVMSGKHKMFCCDAPPFPLFVQPAKGAPYGYGAGLAKLYNSLNATGASNKTLLIPTGRFGANVTAPMATPMTPKFVSLSTMLNWYNAGATLKKGGSWPAGFTGSTWSFCPVAVGPGEPGAGGCAAASLAGPSPRNGRLVRKAGPNKFGGTMALLGGSNTRLKRWVKGPSYPTFFYGQIFVANSPIGDYAAAGNTAMQKQFFNTVPNYTMKATMTVTQSFRGAGPWGTGYAAATVTMNAPVPVVTWANTGYDLRTAMGNGALQLVSGILFNGTAPAAKGTVTLGNTITVTLPEPEPALGIAAGALGLALVGLTRVRRRADRD